MRRLVFFIFLLLFLSVTPAFASNFTTDYIVNYSVGNSANTHVSFDVALTNTTEQYYASSYNIRLGFADVRNIVASDSEGQIKPTVTKSSKGQSVDLTFNKKAVGLGSKLKFNLSFDTNEVAQNIGNIWEINIPGLSNQIDFSSFNGNKISFTKSDLGTSGISIAFGEYQIYSFNLTYHLENSNLFPIVTEIALPPRTNYQDISIDSINPKPKNVRIDKDGNWLASYNLSPTQKINVVVAGKAKVNLSPKIEDVSSNELAAYTRPQRYWETNDPKLKSLAGQLKTPQQIYQYVIDNLTYDFSRVTDKKPRAGALNVLQNPSSAVCLEFSDIFVALARSAGIPAREVDGFANTKNTQERPLSLVKDVLHAWPEYYDSTKQMWIMVDPTWGNTTNGIDYFSTLDFDHFAFAIKGQDSTYPIPAGGYKNAGNLNTKDVNVELSTEFNGSYSTFSELNFPTKSLPGLPITGTVKIRNNGSLLLEPPTIKVASSFLIPDQKESKV